ncbi:hypothetical protein [Congregibacter litoralis]|uniref:hypothetical protein n=1 Tax=Congregibacter litoralis TaxID=393662 RepID=UPI00006B9DDC|nr:hypothetical protein [Congregibacter litoralis]
MLIAGLASWAYAPGIEGPALLDDRSNIPVINPDTLDTTETLSIVFGNTSGPLGRPVAMASFVAEAAILGAGSATGKTVNLGIHLVNTVLVYLLALAIFSKFEPTSSRVCALLVAMVWCWAPLQLSTVLYHVQRMTLLSSSFMLLTLLFTLRWRRSFDTESRMHVFWSAAALVTAILALFAKENAATLVLIVPSLLALYPVTPGRPRGCAVRVAAARIFVVLSAAAICVVAAKWSWIVAGYEVRDFTVTERVLSQPRILFDYIAQFFVPDTGRMGLIHDDLALSSGLFSPPSTVLSILFFSALLALSFWRRQKVLGAQVLMCAAVFLLGHSVESSVIALEPYFEHRNYFPSLGLALALGFGAGAFLKKAPAVKVPLLIWVLIYGGWLLVETGAQARIWSKLEMIALHEVNGHPESPRANRAMALLQAKHADLELAMKYADRAYPEGEPGYHLNRAVYVLALSCVSGQPLDEYDFSSLKNFSGLKDRAAREAMQLLIEGVHDKSCDRAAVLELADRLYVLAASTALNNDFEPLLSTLAVLENALERYGRALWYTQEALSHSPEDVQLMLMKLHFCLATRAEDACEGTRRKLLTLEKDGRLSVEQSEMLALYRTGE